MSEHRKLNVAVLIGGRTAEHEISLKTGQEIVLGLNKEKYRVKPIKIEKNGKWIIPGGYIEKNPSIADEKSQPFILTDNGNLTELNIVSENWPVPDNSSGLQLLKSGGEDQIDVVFIALHGTYGEDGTVQGMLEMMNIPYTGSGVLSSALAMNKAKCKEIYIYNGIKVPAFIASFSWEWERNMDKIMEEVNSKLGYPLVIKPSNLGSSVGTYIVKNEADAIEKIALAFKYDNIVLLEQYIKGIEITCPVLGGFTGEEPEALPLVEIIPPDSAEFFDYSVKYNGTTREVVPARISEEFTMRAQELGVKVHKILGCSGMSRTDIIIKDDDMYVLETNTIPGMTRASLYPQAAKAAGFAFHQLLDRFINIAIDRHKNEKFETEWK